MFPPTTRFLCRSQEQICHVVAMDESVPSTRGTVPMPLCLPLLNSSSDADWPRAMTMPFRTVPCVKIGGINISAWRSIDDDLVTVVIVMHRCMRAWATRRFGSLGSSLEDYGQGRCMSRI